MLSTTYGNIMKKKLINKRKAHQIHKIWKFIQFENYYKFNIKLACTSQH